MAEADGTGSGQEQRQERLEKLRERLLRKAFNEKGAEGHKEMKAFLDRMQQTCEEIPAEHAMVLRELSQTPEGTARGVLMLNALARHEGVNKRFTDEEAGDNNPPSPPPPSGPTIH